MSYILKPIYTGLFCLFCFCSYGQFAFLYEGPDTLYVDQSCTAILDWGHPATPDVFATMPGQVIISWTIFSISGGYSIGDPVPAGETVTVFYQARDNMGHISLFGFNLFVVDSTPPEFDDDVLPVDVTVSCSGAVPIPTLTFSDNCDSGGSMTILTFEESGDPDFCAGGNIVREWTLTDPSGNTASHIQEITVLPDTSDPVITGIPVDGSAVCGDAMTAYNTWLTAQRASFMADDNGCGIASLTDNAPPASVLAGFCGELEVAFFAVDSCDNSISVVASFLVTNNTPPTITTPASNAMASCDSGNPQTALQNWIVSVGGAVAVDDCSFVSWTTDPETPTINDVCNGALVVTFIADDGCGNTASTTAEFFIQDNTPPAITAQAQNRIINCSTADFEVELASWLATNGNAAATDICTDEDSLLVHYMIEGVMLDSAGVIDAFQDSIQNGTCIDGVVIDGFIFNNVLALITLDFVFTDNCGNAATSSGIFAIRDVLGPTWQVSPQDSILTCISSDLQDQFTMWYQSAGFAEATDDCGSIFYTGVPPFEDALAELMGALDTACASGLSVEVAFQLNDFCGNANPTVETAVFGVEANSGPAIVQNPSDLNFACNGNAEVALIAWLDTLGGAQVQQACGDIEWTFTWMENGEFFTGMPGLGPYPNDSLLSCNSSLEVTFIATDICENAISASAAFAFVDTLAPTIEVDSAIAISCDSIEFINISANDNCTASPLISFSDVNMGGDTTQCLNGTILRTWQATDDCGNTTIAVQVINTSDTEAPEFIAPSDTIIYCSNTGEIDSGLPLNIMDNCDANPLVSFEDSISGTPCARTIVRQWIVTDACANVSTSVQEITLLDTVPPELLTSPGDLILECSALVNPEAEFANWITTGAGASLTDNCGEVRYFIASPGSYSLQDTLTWPGEAPVFPMLECGNDTLASLQVDFVYADACGNAEVLSLNILIQDTAAPLIEDCLADTIITLQTGQCETETEVVLSAPRAFDYCQASIDTTILQITQPISSHAPGDSVVVVDTIVFSFNVPGPPAFATSSVSVTVTLFSVDADSISEHFIVLGDNAEVLGLTNTALLECDTSVTSFIIPSEIFNDWSADGIVNFTLIPNSSPGGAASINDICPGATGSVDLTLVQGTQDSLTFEYAVDTLARVALDSLSDVVVDLYAGDHVLTWFITDCAGNESQCVTSILVRDIDFPQVDCPDDISLMIGFEGDCAVPVVLHFPKATDSCGVVDASATYRILGDTIIDHTLFNGADSVTVFLDIGNYNVEYSVTDISGNTALCTFNVSIIDPVSPIAVCQPGIAFVNPSGVVPLQADPSIINGGSTDNCKIDTMIVVPDVFTCEQAGTEQPVQLIIIDESGNADTCNTVLQIEIELLEPTYAVGICANDTLHLFSNVPPAPGNPYTFEWSGPNGFSSFLEDPKIPDVNASYSGTYTVMATGSGSCTTSGEVDVMIDELNAPDLAVAATTICEEDIVMLSSTSYGEPVTYNWFRGVAPGGLFLGTSVSPTFTDVPPLPGQYIYYVVVETANCSSNPSAGVGVEVVETPIAMVQTPFIEVCEGGMFSLGTDISGSGIAYSWTGPEGFNSEDQFPPPLEDVELSQAGTYSLVISIGSCISAPATTDVVVSPRPETPIISGDSIFCEGGNLILTVNNILTADQYIWQTPSMNPISTVGNTLMLNNINESMDGMWTVVAMLGDCPSLSSLPFSVNIEDILPILASNDGPVCDGSGDSVTLFVQIIPGVTYMWEGPDGFMSSLDNPTVLGVEGTYTVTATSSSGCTAISSTTILAEDPPAITALSNTAGICADSSQNLSFAVTIFPPDNGAYDYQWTGPGGFTSNQVNPVISGLTSELNGTYTLIVSLGSCMSDPVSTEVNVLDAPIPPTISGVNEYCSGESILLSTSPYGADSVLYIWNTPTGLVQIWNSNTLMIDAATVTNSGMYSVIVQIDGCDSPSSEVLQVMVAQVVNQPIAQGPMSVCAGDTIQLAAQLINGATYHWTGPGGYESQLQNPFIFPAKADASGDYQVFVQVGECISDVSNIVSVSVLSLPSDPETESFDGSVCLGAPSPLTLCITPNSTTAGAVYTWTHQGVELSTPDSERCITITDFSVFSAGTNSISVIAELSGCISLSSDLIAVPMYDIPEEMANAGPDANYCADDQVSLNASNPSIGVASWSSPDGAIVFDDDNDPFSDVGNLSEGQNMLVWTLDFESCLNYSSDTVIMIIESTPQAVLDSVLVSFGQTVDINVVLNDLITSDFMLRLIPGAPLKGNALYQGQGIITYDPNLGYVGPDRISYEICSVVCPEQCSMALVVIQVGDETDCFIPTIFTPNSDGTNDRLIIPCLETERFPQNRIAIFNEWGDAVYEAQPYLNDWEGTREGKDLPVATYFYIIDFGDGRPVQNGFLILER